MRPAPVVVRRGTAMEDEHNINDNNNDNNIINDNNDNNDNDHDDDNDNNANNDNTNNNTTNNDNDNDNNDIVIIMIMIINIIINTLTIHISVIIRWWCGAARRWRTRKGGCYGRKPSSSSNFSLRACRAPIYEFELHENYLEIVKFTLRSRKTILTILAKTVTLRVSKMLELEDAVGQLPMIMIIIMIMITITVTIIISIMIMINIITDIITNIILVIIPRTPWGSCPTSRASSCRICICMYVCVSLSLSIYIYI